MKELLNKLSKAKQEISPIVKNETNPFFKNKYFDINALLHQVEPILHSHGLLLVQPIKDNKVASVIFDIDSEQSLESSIELPPLTDPQKMGSVITYYRRYTLQSLLSLQAEDDDATLATKKEPKIKPVEGKPKLADDGYTYLMTNGTVDQINEALAGRQMTLVQGTELEGRREELKTKSK
jgi:hypothetical protein